MYNLDTNTLLSSSTAFVNVYENKTVASCCALFLSNEESYYGALVNYLMGTRLSLLCMYSFC